MPSKHLEYNSAKSTFISIMEDKTGFVPQLHLHPTYEIYLTHSGPMSCLINDKIYDLNPNDMLVFAPSDIHMSTRPKNKKYMSTVINFCPDNIKNIGEKTDVLFPFRASADNFSHKVSLSDNKVSDFIDMLKKMESLLKSNNKYNDVRQQILLVEILLFINEMYAANATCSLSEKKHNDEIVTKIMLYINENITENLNLSNLSNRFFISKNILNNHFKRKTGYTLGQYIINYRMYCARQLLESGESVYNTAWKVGYQNTSNFIRAYKKVMRITPGICKIKKQI